MEIIPDISLISTCDASSFSFNVADNESGVIPEVLAVAAAWESVSAAPDMLARNLLWDLAICRKV